LVHGNQEYVVVREVVEGGPQTDRGTLAGLPDIRDRPEARRFVSSDDHRFQPGIVEGRSDM
jgi:hypothetical protein